MNGRYNSPMRFSPALLALLLVPLAGFQPESLVLDRHAVAQGELWRLFTGHFVHCDARHLALNLAGIIGLPFVFNDLSTRKIWSALLLGIAGVNLWIWFGIPELNRYCGLSGIENTLLVAGLHSFWKSERQFPAVAAGTLCLLKIVFEIFHQSPLLTDLSWGSVPQAHAAGFAAGLVLPPSWKSISGEGSAPIPT